MLLLMQEEELLILEGLLYTSLYKEKYKEGQVAIVFLPVGLVSLLALETEQKSLF